MLYDILHTKGEAKSKTNKTCENNNNKLFHNNFSVISACDTRGIYKVLSFPRK